MSKSTVYLSSIGVAIGAATILALSAGACSAGQACQYLPAVVNAARPTATPTPAGTRAPATAITGLAILGDSTQDEYQADNPRGAEYNATTLNWVEQLARGRGLNLGTWQARPEPRRGGFEYNWARSAATSADMIATGQHTGAAAQIRSGAVSHAAIQIGINDFYASGLGTDIYEGRISGPALTSRLDEIVANITLATRTLRDANPRGVLLAATQDYTTLGIVPEIRIQYPDANRLRLVINAFGYINARLRDFANREGIPFFDYNAAMLTELNARRDAQGFLAVGGQRVDLNRRGNAPLFGLLDDQYVHPGTIISGLSANVYIRAFNDAFGTNIAPFTDQEILATAGITP